MQDCIGVTYRNSVNTETTSAKVPDCIGVTSTATQSILELFKLEVDLFLNFISAKVTRLQKSHLHSNSTLELFKLEVDYIINFLSPKLQNCIGVTYTATQSTLDLFNLEVDYSSILFWQKFKIAKESLTLELNTGTI